MDVELPGILLQVHPGRQRGTDGQHLSVFQADLFSFGVYSADVYDTGVWFAWGGVPAVKKEKITSHFCFCLPRSPQRTQRAKSIANSPGS